MILPAISIIIPNWNGKQHLTACLTSLRRQTFQKYEVIVADNGSTDGSQELIRADYPDVRLIELGRNIGFTGACNAGWHAARGDVIILLNNDTEVDSGWLGQIMAAFAMYPEVGIVASKMLLFDKRDHFHTAGDYYRVDGIPGNRGVWQQDVGQYDSAEYVFSACGGSSAYRRTLIDQIGFLDNDFFFSCEDVDLAWRAQIAGWRTLYLPDAIVYHKLKATGGGVTSSYYDGRNFLYLIWKNYPTSLLKRHWKKIVRAQGHITIEALRHWRGKEARARLRGQVAGLLGAGRMLRKRRAVQATRRVADEYLT
ncbi:MAG: glycosyltransferase family 2 protein, partial [Methylococcales bacterium]|nr:glycosyltransferase family 2 protein [Methylococcales bacterium]